MACLKWPEMAYSVMAAPSWGRYYHQCRTVKCFQARASRPRGVSRAWITQIMNLRLLAPHIQEKLLFHERVHSTKDSMQ